MTRAGTTSVPGRPTRLGVVISADPESDFAAEGVLNPARPERSRHRPGPPPSPLLEPLTAGERQGTIPNVVFPTAIEEIDGQQFVFYGMADSSIGVVRLDRTETPKAPHAQPARHRPHGR